MDLEPSAHFIEALFTLNGAFTGFRQLRQVLLRIAANIGHEPQDQNEYEEYKKAYLTQNYVDVKFNDSPDKTFEINLFITTKFINFIRNITNFILLPLFITSSIISLLTLFLIGTDNDNTELFNLIISKIALLYIQFSITLIIVSIIFSYLEIKFTIAICIIPSILCFSTYNDTFLFHLIGNHCLLLNDCINIYSITIIGLFPVLLIVWFILVVLFKTVIMVYRIPKRFHKEPEEIDSVIQQIDEEVSRLNSRT